MTPHPLQTDDGLALYHKPTRRQIVAGLTKHGVTTVGLNSEVMDALVDAGFVEDDPEVTVEFMEAQLEEMLLTWSCTRSNLGVWHADGVRKDDYLPIHSGIQPTLMDCLSHLARASIRSSR